MKITAQFLKRPVIEDSLPAIEVSGESHANLWEQFISGIQALPPNTSQQNYAEMENYDSELRAIVQGIFDYSPHLTRSLMLEPQILVRLCDEGGDATLHHLAEEARAILQDEAILADVESLMLRLRSLKRQLSLALGILDLSGRIKLFDLTRSLSDFADSAVAAALLSMWRRFGERGYLDAAATDEIKGIFVLGLGKYGGLELNYSSDIDLILLFDSARLPLKEEHKDNTQEILNRGVRQFVKILDEANRDGFVFRVDLELRPDPLSTPPIISVLSAINYYAGVGQTWERAAFIKARTVAGDTNAGNAFLAELSPFVWRKSLDYYALNEIADVRARMLLTKSRGEGDYGIANFNVKLSFGGIREIEFLIQSQQLIWGGRNAFLRAAPAMEALHRLVMEGRLPERVLTPLTGAYNFLRQVEHRLQMLANEQTQTLPRSDESLKNFALFCGFGEVKSFAHSLLSHIDTARALSEEFGPKELHAEGYGSDGGEESDRLMAILTAEETDSQDIKILESYGFHDCVSAQQIMRVWLSGGYRATRSEKSIRHLTALLPILLRHFRDSGSADTTLVNFDKFLQRLPFGVQFFALLRAHSELCSQLLAILGGAPTIGNWLSENPHLLDALLESQVAYQELSHLDHARVSLNELLIEARDLDEVLRILQRWVNDYKFLCRVHFFNGTTDIYELCQAETKLAELTLETIVPRVIEDYNHSNKARSGSGDCLRIEDYFSIFAFGKFGSEELLPLSDLDLIFVFDLEMDAEVGYGLLAMVYFVRLSQRILTALSSESGEGSLYSVDMRLRPSGNKSSIATPLARFSEYYLNGEAWMWERMTLLRGRCVWGGEKSRSRMDGVRLSIFGQSLDGAVVLSDLYDMWVKTRETHAGASIWDIKYRRGGMQDLEYIIYGLQLLHGGVHSEIMGLRGEVALRAMRDLSIIDSSVCDGLCCSYVVWMSLGAAFRLIFGDDEIIESELSIAQIDTLCRILVRSCGVDVSDLSSIKSLMEASASVVGEQFDRLYGSG